MDKEKLIGYFIIIGLIIWLISNQATLENRTPLDMIGFTIILVVFIYLGTKALGIRL